MDAVAADAVAEDLDADLEVAGTVVAAKTVKAVKHPNIRVPNTQICLQESGRGVAYIINGGKGLIFVLNPPPAPGKMSSPPGQANETGTSPPVTSLALTVI